MFSCEKFSIISPTSFFIKETRSAASSTLSIKTPIFSIGNPGDQTYEYKIIGDNTQTIKDIIEEKHEFNRVFDTAKKPLIIIGESALELNSGGFIFEELKNFLYQKKLISEKWNALNILIQNASTVGA